MVGKDKQIVKFSIAKSDLEQINREAKTLGLERSAYLRTLVVRGKDKLFIEYIHGLVEQINIRMGELAEQKSAQENPASSPASADVLQRILTGLQILHGKIEHIEAFADARAAAAFGVETLHRHGVDGQAIQKPAAEIFCRKWKK